MYAGVPRDDAGVQGTVRPRLVEAEPEVHEGMGPRSGSEDDVRRLDVAVEDKEARVGVAGHRPVPLRSWAASGQARAVIPQPPPRSGPSRNSDDDVDLSPFQADVVDRHDAGKVAQDPIYVSLAGPPPEGTAPTPACGTSGPLRRTLMATGLSSCVSWPCTAPKPPVPKTFRTW